VVAAALTLHAPVQLQSSVRPVPVVQALSVVAPVQYVVAVGLTPQVPAQAQPSVAPEPVVHAVEFVCAPQ